MNINKITGYLLLVLGVVIILFSLYYSFNIFTAKTPAPEVFPAIWNEEESEKELKPEGDVQAQAEKMVKEQLKEIIPIGYLPKLFNLISWSLLAGILIFGGSKISGLGIKLMKG